MSPLRDFSTGAVVVDGLAPASAPSSHVTLVSKRLVWEEPVSSGCVTAPQAGAEEQILFPPTSGGWKS